MTLRAFSLHHLVAPEIPAVELVKIASELGCPYVCLFTQDPASGIDFPIVPDREIADLRKAMDDHQVRAYGVTSFLFTPDMRVSSFEPGIERGAQLGASLANARILDDDEPRVIDNFAAFADLCARSGIKACIEFTGIGNTDGLPQAVRILRGAKRGGLSLDALHIARTGTPLESVRSLPLDLIGYVQICDGPLHATAEHYAREGAYDRLAPGEGAFPLKELLSIVPAECPVSLEVPCERLRIAGLSPFERAKHIVDATRRFLNDEHG